MKRRGGRTVVAQVFAGCLPLAGCAGVQSALAPAGIEAESVARLFLVMTVAGALIWAGVVVLLLHATRPGRPAMPESLARQVVLWGGAALPSACLALLLGYALWLMPQIRPWAERLDDAGLRIEVEAQQFWWRVTYHAPGGEMVASANELRLPVGEKVAVALTSPDVIHSFWIPALAGKMDAIPGRTNHLVLEATRPGTYRGACAEYCGTSHALMALPAIAMEPDAFREWLSGQRPPAAGAPRYGEALFLRHGCGACHRIAGTAAQSAVGPDLSRLGSRLSLAAGVLPNTKEAIARFITAPDIVKPGTAMPSFAMLPEEDVAAIAAYLKALR